jgi:hypothetical protein
LETTSDFSLIAGASRTYTRCFAVFHYCEKPIFAKVTQGNAATMSRARRQVIKAYRKIFRQLARRAGVEPHNHAAVVDWFVTQDNIWSASTISQHRAAITQAIEDDLAPAGARDVEHLFTRLAAGPKMKSKIVVGVDGTGRPVSKSLATIEAYRVRLPQLARKAGVQPHDHAGVVNWFVTQDDTWSASTISQYRAAIIQAIEDNLANSRAEYVEHLLIWLAAGPSARVGGPRRTSARKRKSIPRPEFVRLIQYLTAGRKPYDILIARILTHNVRLFLRKVEWQTADVQSGFLVIQNAKATNGRTFGPERRRDLSNYGSDGITDLRDLLATLTDLASTAEEFKKLWGRLASRLARVCKQVGVKRVAPYTTRHVGMANAKSWMSPAEVAASAGHKTTATATSHYARRRTGWGANVERVAAPSPADVEKVIGSPKSTRKNNLEYLASKRAEREARERAEREAQEETTNPAFRI